jgi:hypothetical protein
MSDAPEESAPLLDELPGGPEPEDLSIYRSVVTFANHFCPVYLPMTRAGDEQSPIELEDTFKNAQENACVTAFQLIAAFHRAAVLGWQRRQLLDGPRAAEAHTSDGAID